MSKNNVDWFKIWLEEIRSPHPDMARAAAAARRLASLPPRAYQEAGDLRLWAAALAGTAEDAMDCDACQARLPDFIHAQTGQALADEAVMAQFAGVRTHLAHCPYCMAAYAQVTEWVLASQADAIPVAETHPTFDLAFLAEEPTRFAWPAALVERARAEGKRWLADVQGGLYLLFGPGLQTQTAGGWALKSGAPGRLLAQLAVGETEVAGWEIEAAAFADEDEATTCHVEVSLYALALPATSAAAVPVTLHYAGVTQTQTTDESGVAQFTGAPIDQLPQVVLRIHLAHRPPADEA